MSNDTTVSNLIINTMSEAQFNALETPSNTELYFVEETEDTTYAKDAQVVHNTGNENINGIKTFVTGAIINNGTATTPSTTDNSNKIATTAYVQNVIAALLTRIEELEQQVAAKQ